MKKIVAGFVAGVLFAIGATSFADGVSLVGKKIQSEVTVTAKGEQLPDKAIVVDGKSYAPVRAVAQAAGMEVEFGKGGIVLTETAQEPAVNPVKETTPEQPTTGGQLPADWENDRTIKEAQEDIKLYQERIERTKKSLSDPSSTLDEESAQTMIEDYQTLIERREKLIEERKAKLAEENK